MEAPFNNKGPPDPDYLTTKNTSTVFDKYEYSILIHIGGGGAELGLRDTLLLKGDSRSPLPAEPTTQLKRNKHSTTPGCFSKTLW